MQDPDNLTPVKVNKDAAVHLYACDPECNALSLQLLQNNKDGNAPVSIHRHVASS